MTDAAAVETTMPDQLVEFWPTNLAGIESAFIGVHLIGAVRHDPPGWRSFLNCELRSPYHAAADVEAAREKLRQLGREWYDALHQRMRPDQALRLSRLWIA